MGVYIAVFFFCSLPSRLPPGNAYSVNFRIFDSLKMITRNIWILSLVSLFNDVASEMIYPVMPMYLKSIGFSIILIGVLEGVAEAVAGLSKGYFGSLSDTRQKRLPFVQIGYAFSAVSKSMLVLFAYPFWVFLARTVDRLGKGIRTGARDALLSDEATPKTKARVFGFHRSMDTLGAAIGPLVALVYLIFFPDNYTTLFFIAFVPSVIAITFTFFIKERERPSRNTKTNFFSFFRYWQYAPSDYRKLVRGLLIFALFNSSDVFLLLKAKEMGFTDQTVIGVYIFYNLVYAAFSYPIGILADKIGMKKIFALGLVLFGLVYFGMPFAKSKSFIILLFFLYGVYSAATEGIAKAWITNITNKSTTATAVGTYAAFQSLAALIASSLAGFIWYVCGPSVMFMLSGGVAFCVAFFIATFKTNSLTEIT